MYGLSKAQGEIAVRSLMKRYFLLRTSWVFGLHGKNFVKTMIRLGKEKSEIRVVDDQIGSPTYTADLARVICDMIPTEKYGIYHVCNEGYMSWAGFARLIMAERGLRCSVIPVPTSGYPTPARRPLNSRMSTRRLRESGFGPMPTVEDALSRFMQGLIQEIKAPVYETRMAILNRKVQESGCTFNDEVLQYIAKNVKSDIRKLEGALGKIVSTQHLHNSELEPVSLDTAKDLLKDFIDEESQRTPTPDDIIKAVAEYYKIRPEDIKSKKRTKEIATPRHVAMYLIRVMTDYTLKDVGDIIGSRDHTTIKYGFEKIMTEMNEREEFKKTIETLKKKILG